MEKIIYVEREATGYVMCADCKSVIVPGEKYYHSFPGPQAVCARCHDKDLQVQEQGES